MSGEMLLVDALENAVEELWVHGDLMVEEIVPWLAKH